MIIFISGSINSGKSTVAKILAEKIKNSAVIEVDELREFINFMSLDEAIPLNLENTVSLIKNFNARGINCIIPYPISQNNYDFLINNLSDIKDIHFFALNPSKLVALSNRGNRELSDQEKERISYHYSIGINNPDFAQIIDNSNLSPEETAIAIIDLL
jgi:AAA+ ATPase superfamily predicted ATPase